MHARLLALESRLKTLKAVAVAFSGGLDSRLLTHLALRAGVRVTAVHVAGPHIPKAETAMAGEWAAARGVPLRILTPDVLGIAQVAAGARDRCYHCKKALFTAMREAAGEIPLCDGTNASDKGAYRPGLKALEELGILSPLADAGLTKDDIRALAARTGLDRPGQGARPCLLTRFDYGLSPDAATLAALDAAEEAVADALIRHGVFSGTPGEAADFRLRVEEGGGYSLHVTARALPGKFPGALERELETLLARHGFAGTALVPGERVSGYFDRKANLA